MTVELTKVLGAELAPTTYSWDEESVILYHLGLGAGQPSTSEFELSLTYEAGLQVLPTFATIPPFLTMLGIGGVEGLEFNPALLLHGEHEIRLERDIPTSGTVTNEGKIVEVWDKGKGALLVVEVVSRDKDGSTLFTNRGSLYLRGEGGFGGKPGPSPANEAPQREPDWVLSSPTLPQQALIYRLSGDKNPLHADPEFAAFAGFDRPILHGLSSFGTIAKAVISGVMNGDSSAMRRFRARFTGPVYPGETIVTNVWRELDRLLVSAFAVERNTPVLANAAVWS